MAEPRTKTPDFLAAYGNVFENNGSSGDGFVDGLNKMENFDKEADDLLNSLVGDENVSNTVF